MTDVRKELDAIRARLDAAEPGPWFTSGRWWLEGVNHYVVDGPKGPMTRNDLAYLYTEADAELVAHAPTDLARLVKAVECGLALHQPDYADLCACCEYRWPCLTVRAIIGALWTDDAS